MATRCFTPVLGKRLRATVLDTCGTPPAPATPNSLIATDGFISVGLSAEVEDGNEIITRKANGQLCVNERTNDSFKRFTVTAEFCGVNPSLLAMVSNAEEYNNWAGEVAGITIGEGDITGKFALELWTGLAGAACATGADEASGYLLLPFVNAGVIGDLTIDGENAVSFTLNGAFTKGGNDWGTGPYDVLIGGVGAANEVQRVTITGTPTGGTFTLTFDGQTTNPIPYNAAASAVQTALEALSNIDPGDVTCGGGPLPGAFVTVTFGGDYASEDVPQMTANSAGLTGGTTPTVTVTTTTPGSAGAAAQLPEALDPLDHLLLIETGLALPPSACSPAAMPS